MKEFIEFWMTQKHRINHQLEAYKHYIDIPLYTHEIYYKIKQIFPSIDKSVKVRYSSIASMNVE